MKPTSYQNFARLLESIVMEASTAIDMVKMNPGGREIAQFLHTKSALGHDADWEIVKKIPWSEIKGGAWERYQHAQYSYIILIGRDGTGAIRASGSDYLVSASNGKPPEVNPDTGVDSNRFFNKASSSGGRSIEMIKDVIGPIKSYAIAKRAIGASVKKKARQELRKTQVRTGGRDIASSEDALAASDAMLARFKPLWVKMLTQAMADIKGFVGLQIKNHAFSKVQNKIERLKALEDVLDSLQTGGEDGEGAMHDYLKRTIYNAVDLSARHYYPDDMPDRQQLGSRYSYGSAPEGAKKLLNDIARGDTRKLGTVLGFFKRALLTT